MFDLNQAINEAGGICRRMFPDQPPMAKALEELEAEDTSEKRKRRLLILLGMVAGRPFIGPHSLLLDMVGTCNLNCIYCRDHSPFIEQRESWRDMEMPFELIDRLIDEAVALGTGQVLLLGAGEPFLHSRFIDILAKVKSQPVAFETFTNGLAFNESVREMFLDAERGRIHFSVSAASDEVFLKLRPTKKPGLYQKIENNIAYLTSNRKPGLRVITVHVINNLNFHEVIPMMERAIELGVDEVQYKLTELNEIGPALKLTPEQMHSVELEMKHVKQIAAQAGVEVHDNIDYQFDNYNPESGHFSERVYDRIGCNMGWELVRVRRDGEVSFCCGLKFLDNINEKSLAEYWHGETLNEARIAARGFPAGRDMKTPGGGMLKDKQCDYCYNYISNYRSRDDLKALGLLPLYEKSL